MQGFPLCNVARLKLSMAVAEAWMTPIGTSTWASENGFPRFDNVIFMTSRYTTLVWLLQTVTRAACCQRG